MFCFFKHRLPDRVFKNNRSTETPAGPGRPSRAWVRTDYNLASVSSKGRKSGVRPVLGKRRTDWTLGNTEDECWPTDWSCPPDLTGRTIRNLGTSAKPGLLSQHGEWFLPCVLEVLDTFKLRSPGKRLSEHTISLLHGAQLTNKTNCDGIHPSSYSHPSIECYTDPFSSKHASTLPLSPPLLHARSRSSTHVPISLP